MHIITLLVLSISIGTILLVIHDRDEIHQVLAFLSGLIAFICIFILSPLLLKGLLGLVLLTIGRNSLLAISFYINKY